MNAQTSHYLLTDIVDRNADNFARRQRIAVSQLGEHRSFGELQSRSRKLAHGHAGLGITRGDRVAVLMGNRLAWPEALFGITSLGAAVVAVNVLLTSKDVNAVIDDAAPRALIVDETAEPALAALSTVPELLITVGQVTTPNAQRRIDFDQLIADASDQQVRAVAQPSDPAMIYYTSGTTGAPKAVVHSHQGILWNTNHQIGDLGISAEETYLVVPSLSWGAGFHDVTLALLWAGGRAELLATGAGTLDRIVYELQRVRANRTLLVPTLLKQLLSSPEHLARLRDSPLRRVMSGAEPLPTTVTGALATELPQCAVTQTYGMTEFPMIATVTLPEEAVSHAGKAGRASSIATLAVRRANGTITDHGDGEILLRSPATMLGYRNRPVDNANVFRDGWLHTGDLGRIDDEGYLTVTGRTKDVIISGG